MFYQSTVILPIARMKAIISLLETIVPQAQDRKMSDADLLDLRLVSDMFPLAKQIQIVSDNAKGMVSRLTGREIPKMEDTESTVSELIARLEKTIEYVSSFTEADFADAANTEVRIAYFPGLHLTGTGYVYEYALANFFFHVVTVYDILRHHGFEIGKSDYMGKNVPFIANKA